MMIDEVSVPLSAVITMFAVPLLGAMYYNIIKRIDKNEEERKLENKEFNARLTRVEIDGPKIYATKVELQAAIDSLSHHVKGLRREQSEHAREMHEAVQFLRETLLIVEKRGDEPENFPHRRGGRHRRKSRRSKFESAMAS